MGITDYLVNNSYLNDNGIDQKSGNNISLSGAVYSTTAKLGSHSVYFDGIDDIGTQESSTNLDETAPFAWACWFKPDTTQESYANIMGIRVSTAAPADILQGIGITVLRFNGVANTLQFLARNTLGQLKTLVTTKGYKDDIWHLLIVGRDSSNQLRINVDNGDTDITGDVLTGSWWESGDFFKIGAFRNAEERYKGYIDNILTLNAWPSSAEISEIWNGGAGIEIAEVGSPWYYYAQLQQRRSIGI